MASDSTFAKTPSATRACRADPDQLLALWSHEELRIVTRRPADLDNHPDLPLRLRGAMGRKLFQMPPSTRLGVTRNAFDELFGENPAHDTRPMTIDADVAAGLVTIDLRLFGSARVHLRALCEAMLAALEEGVSLRPGGQRVPFEPLDCFARRVAPPWPAPASREAIVLFKTPVVLRSGGRLSTSHGALLNALTRRVNGLARWAGVEPTFDESAASKAAAAIDLTPLESIPVHMSRWSRRNPGEPIPVSGFLGKVRLSGPLETFTPYLTLARSTHIGSHAALGFGRVEVAIF
jgi:hypothetical protein